MHDVAARVGVSPSTVSRALRGDPRISEKTRERVRKAAAELGFRSDPGAANLVAHRWRREQHQGGLNIGFLHRPGSAEARRDLPVFRACAESAGFILDLIEIKEIGDWVQLRRILPARGISGLILELRVTEAERKAAADVLRDYSAVFANAPQIFQLAPVVTREPFYRVRDAILAVHRLGYRRIGLMVPGLPIPGNPLLEKMEAAYLLCGQELAPETALFLGLYQNEILWPEWLENRRCDCLIGFDDLLGDALEKRRSIPGEIAFASLAAVTERFAGVGETRESVIQNAIELLAIMIRAGQPGSALPNLRHEVRGLWRDGPSCPPKID